jgi:hemoglobin
LAGPVPDITEAGIQDLVRRFYAKVRQDPLIGPIFNARIKDWDHHLGKLTDFWSSVILKSGRYKGNPMLAHLRLKAVQPAHFERWLALFAETASEVFAPQAADAFIARAELIGRSLQLGMFYRNPSATRSEQQLADRDHNHPNREAVTQEEY